MSTFSMDKFRGDFSLSRRRMVQGLGATGAALAVPGAIRGAEAALRVAGKDIEIQLTSVSPHTFRITVQPIEAGKLAGVADDGTLIQTSFGAPAARLRGTVRPQTVKLAVTASARAFLTFSEKGCTFG
jgi:hypothetical protein